MESTKKSILDDIPIDKPVLMSPKQLKQGRCYQRSIMPHHLRKIKASMQILGYVPGEAVYITPDFWIIDGQHRIVAARELNISRIPACVVHCKNIEQESKFFFALNDLSKKLCAPEKWYARAKWGHPLACLLQRLNDDTKSFLHKRVSLKGERSPNKFSPSQTVNMIIVVIFGEDDIWEEKKDDKYCKMAEAIDYNIAREKMNAFIEWFDACFFEGKNMGSPAYKDKGSRSIAILYMEIMKTGCFVDKKNGRENYSNGISKMKNFIFPRDWMKKTFEKRVNDMIDHWNLNKRSYRVPEYKDPTIPQ